VASYSNASLSVYYSGVSFAGNYEDNLEVYPYSASLAKKVGHDGLPILEQALVERVRRFERDDIDLLLGQLADYRSGSAVSLAFAVDWENVAIEEIGGLYKLVIDLHAQILLFDYSSMQVIGSYPVAVQVRDVTEEQPTEEYIAAVIEQLYLGDAYKVNIFDEFIERLKNVPIKTSFKRYLRVRSVPVEDKAIVHLPASDPGSVRQFQTLVAQSFGKFLSLNQGVALLPYTKGEAIGSKMALTFANGDVFNLEIPSPDFAIDITVRGFKKAKAGQNHAKVAWVYGSYINLKVEQPDFQKVYTDLRVKNAAIKEVPVSQSDVDDWTAYQESLFSLFDKLAREVSKPSKQWLKKSANAPDAKKQLAAFNKLLEQSK
jgi:hypothetical protein